MSALGHCTDFAAACKPTESPLSRMLNQFASAALLPVGLVCLVEQDQLDERNKPDRPDQPDKPDEPPVLGLRLAGGLCLFALEFGPPGVEPLRGCAGCVQRLGSCL